MKIKVSEATNIQLDWLVAACEGEKRLHTTRRQFGIDVPVKVAPKYSTNWTHGGPIIERDRISISWNTDTLYGVPQPRWLAELPGLDYIVEGPTTLIAAMRCYVVSKLCDEVEVPDDLA